MRSRANMLHPVPPQDQPLPEYERPPVVEVALAIQLEGSIGFRSLDLAAIAGGWADALPHVEERAPLPMMGPEPQDPDVTLEVSDEANTPRLWLQDAVGNRVLQIQQDRIVVNWRKGGTDDPYPRYDTIRDSLVDAWGRLTGAMSDLGLALPPPSICEVVYVNHLGAIQGWRSAEDTARLLAPWDGSMHDDFLPTDRHEGFVLHYHLPEGRGWLDIDGWTSDTRSNDRIMVLTLTSRGRASSSDLGGALDFMNLAHEWIVRGFTSVTTSFAHEKWGRKT